jgi:predicted dinucleotide-binding enzyme
MKTAIIGLGNIASRLVANLAIGGEGVIVSERTLDKAQQLAAKLGSRAQAIPIDNALKVADIVILAVWFDAIKKFIAAHGDALAGKIVVDPSNPIAPDGKGGFKKIILADQSSGAIISGLLPQGAELVKGVRYLSAESLCAAANRSPKRAVLFYAADYPQAGKVVANLISASGFAPVNVGGIDQSIRIEVGGDRS